MDSLDFNQPSKLALVLEALLLAASKALSVEQIIGLFDEDRRPSSRQIKAALKQLDCDIQGRSYQLIEVASGYRLQVRDQYAVWVSRLWEERPQRYSRAMLETLALIAYRQPITRGEIEDVRGVAVSSNIIKTLQEREWIRVVGYKDVPGKPAMLATTKAFLDYFNLRGLDELPNLSQLQTMKAEHMQKTEQPKVQIWAAEEPQGAASAEFKQDTDNASRISFGTLLDELESMESNLTTDFQDLQSSNIENT
ncbi:SMC-Scp complex subunit ScpB [Denitrificimonas sp. JX-1]|uniref:SMC-Scp complex subunit ScpB n=1 Tax=Denitrificimonas halotolerans TaxID=3098930 RepID=A0ABU5GPN7_9GAMM|nr:SMC-Scp complex subunit ScpB [Denitrificimonas sp. JX-1]MDY7218960.1 SMC-Scp complex subunit ScpB [Denitrificimonas sp. JX-1]